MNVIYLSILKELEAVIDRAFLDGRTIEKIELNRSEFSEFTREIKKLFMNSTNTMQAFDQIEQKFLGVTIAKAPGKKPDPRGEAGLDWKRPL